MRRTLLCLLCGITLAVSSSRAWADRFVGVEKGSAAGVHLDRGSWKKTEDAVVGQGIGNVLLLRKTVERGDFTFTAKLRLEGQSGSAASFLLGESTFGFEGRRNTVFVNGPLFGGKVRLLETSSKYFESEKEFEFRIEAKGDAIRFFLDGKQAAEASYDGRGFERMGFSPWRATMHIATCSIDGKELREALLPSPRGYSIPLIDLASEKQRQVIVDRESDQYLGHPTTVLLEDGRTMLCVYPKGHGKGAIVYKRSTDGGLTWSDRLKTPASWATSMEVPTIHRVVDAEGKKRLIMWSGLYPARLAVSEDDGLSWSELEPAGDWGGIVVMGFVEQLKAPGHYLAMFHDDGRFFSKNGKRESPVEFRLFKTFSRDGGLSWSQPEVVWKGSKVHLCEPGSIRSPNGKQIAVLLRENARRRNSFVIFSDDEGATWTKPRELPGSLTGDRHTAKYLEDGRLFISFRDRTHVSETKGDWVAWVGTYEDIVLRREGQYRVRLMDNHKSADCAYPGVEVLPDQTIVTTTYGHWTAGEAPYIVSVRLKLAELDAKMKAEE